MLHPQLRLRLRQLLLLGPAILAMAADDPLTPAELAFRKLLEPVKNKHTGHLELKPEYSKLCAAARLAWERANVVWFYGKNEHGKGVWGSKRPNPELAAALKARGEHYYCSREQFLAEQESDKRFALVKRIG